MPGRPAWVLPMLPRIRAQHGYAQQPATTAQPVILRPARQRDIPCLTRWDTAPHIVEISGTDGPVNWSREISAQHPWQKLLIAELGVAQPRPIGVVVIIDPAEEETAYWAPVEPNLRAIDIWIGETDCLARGYGSVIMRRSLAMCFGEGCDAVLVDPLVNNVRAHRFYRKMGFRVVGRRWFGGDECLVHRIDRADYEADGVG